MLDDSGAAYLEDILQQFRDVKALGDKALARVTDEEFFAALDPEANSIAVLVKHLAGNMRSRWRDFLTSDGEKPDRDRDREFEIASGDTQATLMERWEAAWRTLFDALKALTGADLTRTVTIRGESHSVVRAINRQMTHYAYHVGQIVFLAKHFRSEGWQSLSVPRGGTRDFNASMRQRWESR